MGAYVTPMYGGSDAQVNYRLGLVQHGCDSDRQFSYHADAAERPLRWIGRGLETFGVEGLTAGAELTGQQHEMARRLIRGQHPVTGEQLVTPKVAVPAAAKVSLGPLVAAVEEAARARGVSPEALFDTDALAGAWERAARGVARRGGRAVARVDEAVLLAEAAGLAPGEVWGADRVVEARAALYEPREVRDPATGKPVRDADGTPRIEMVARRERVGIAGYDIGITLPKSLSVLLAFAPERVGDRVEELYAQAADRALGWTEERTSYVKRGKHGAGHSARQERSSGFSGWVMTHRAARPVGGRVVGDPHWHVHITIGNLARAADGTWLTVAAGGRELMRHAAAIDKLTQADIRADLYREFGITFARGAGGAWEVEHVPQAALDLFSKRHQQVTEVLAALGYSNATASAKDARVLTRASRSGKSETTTATDVTLREFWRDEAVAAGYDSAGWMPTVLAGYRAGHAGGDVRANETMLARHGVTLDDVVAQVSDPENGLTAHTRRFSHLDAITAVADALPQGASVGEVEALTELVLSHPMVVALPEPGALVGPAGERAQLAGSHQMTGGALYTTRDVPEAEREILERVRAVAAAGPGRCRVAPVVLAAAVAQVETAQGYALAGEQREVLARVVGEGRVIESVEGPPGTGKTTLMRAARVAWEAQGWRVAGAATSATASQKLAGESGIASRTVAQWVWAIDHGSGLGGVDKLVLDEANLTDDRDRLLLYREAARTGTEIVEVHDPQQLRTPGCGSLAGYIHAQLAGPRLTENRRQRSEDERAALALYREGRHQEALGRWDALGQVVATTSSEQAVAAMVAEWLRRAEGAPDPHTRAEGLLMVAATNDMVDRLNAGVQAVRDAEGQLGAGRDFALPGGRSVSFHVGDQVLIRRNDRTQQAVSGEAVLNGYHGTVTDVTSAGVAVAWRQPGDTAGQVPHTAVCSPSYIAEGGLELGYALTAHKAEGTTVGAGWAGPDGFRNDGTVLVWAPGMDRAGLYVAASRDRGQTLLYGALDVLEGEREQRVYGTPRDQAEITTRAIAALAARADATAANPDDRPVLADLGRVPAEPGGGQARQPGPSSPVEQSLVEESERRTEQRDGHAGVVGRDRDLDPGLAADVDLTVDITAEQRQRWTELGDRAAQALIADDAEAARAVRGERDAYAAGLGPGRVARLAQDDREQLAATLARWDRERSPAAADVADGPSEGAGAGGVEVTEAQRERWAELTLRAGEAWLGGGAERDAAQAALRGYAGELGAARVAQLRRETLERLAVQRAELDRRTAWRARPHHRLSDNQVAAAIARAAREREQHLAAVERTRARLTGTAAAVAAGRGPRVTDLEATLHRMRHTADLHDRVEAAEQRWNAARGEARRAGARAAEAFRAAERVPWWRPGQREQRHAEAAEQQARHEQARAAAEELDRHLAQLQQQVGPRAGYRGWAREQLERAEAGYDRDRDATQQADEAELAGLHRQVDARTRAADRAGDRHTGLTGEQQHRALVPVEARGEESRWRLDQAAAELRAARAADLARPDHSDDYSPGLGHHRSYDRGPDRGDGLGLGR